MYLFFLIICAVMVGMLNVVQYVFCTSIFNFVIFFWNRRVKYRSDPSTSAVETAFAQDDQLGGLSSESKNLSHGGVMQG